MMIKDQETNMMWSKVASGLTADSDTKTIIRVKGDEGIAGEVATTRKTVNVPDAYKHAKFSPETDIKTGYKTQSILCVPILNQKQEVLGVIQMINKLDSGGEPVPFEHNDECSLEVFVTHVSVAITNARIFEGTAEQLSDVISMAAAVPDILIALDSTGAYLTSNRPLDQILASAPPTSAAGDGGERPKLDLSALSAALAEDVTSVLEAAAPAVAVCKPEETFAEGSVAAGAGECVGYEVVPLPLGKKTIPRQLVATQAEPASESQSRKEGVLVVIKTVRGMPGA